MLFHSVDTSGHPFLTLPGTDGLRPEATEAAQNEVQVDSGRRIGGGSLQHGSNAWGRSKTPKF